MKFIKPYKLFEYWNKIPLKTIIHTKGAYDILDEVDGNTWQEGGCRILADTINMVMDAPIYVIFNNELNRVDHFVVKLGSQFFDSDGYQSEKELINKNVKEQFYKYSPQVFTLIPYTDDMNSGDIIQDLNVSQKLKEYIETY